MTALPTSYTRRNFSQRWPSCHLQNSNLLPFPLLVQLHLHFSQGLLFSLWWNSNGTKIIFSFASTCTIGQGNFQCCSKTEGRQRCSFALSSPRAKRVGPKGLRTESARAFTGRRNSHSEKGEDFMTRQLNFFTETAVTPERKVEKSFPRSEINRHAEG